MGSSLQVVFGVLWPALALASGLRLSRKLWFCKKNPPWLLPVQKPKQCVGQWSVGFPFNSYNSPVGSIETATVGGSNKGNGGNSVNVDPILINPVYSYGGVPLQKC